MREEFLRLHPDRIAQYVALASARGDVAVAGEGGLASDMPGLTGYARKATRKHTFCAVVEHVSEATEFTSGFGVGGP